MSARFWSSIMSGRCFLAGLGCLSGHRDNRSGLKRRLNDSGVDDHTTAPKIMSYAAAASHGGGQSGSYRGGNGSQNRGQGSYRNYGDKRHGMNQSSSGREQGGTGYNDGAQHGTDYSGRGRGHQDYGSRGGGYYEHNSRGPFYSTGTQNFNHHGGRGKSSHYDNKNRGQGKNSSRGRGQSSFGTGHEQRWSSKPYFDDKDQKAHDRNHDRDPHFSDSNQNYRDGQGSSEFRSHGSSSHTSDRNSAEDRSRPQESRKNFGSGDGGRNKGRQDTGQNFHGKNNNEGKGFDRRQSLPRRNIEKDKPQPLLEGAVTWLGVPITELKRAPDCYREEETSLSSLTSSSNHRAFVKLEGAWLRDEVPEPLLLTGNEAIGDDCVCLPHSTKADPQENGPSFPRWEKIKQALKRNISGNFELEEVILSYNPQFRKKWNFEALHRYVWEMDTETRDEFFEVILPKMQNLALQLPTLVPETLPILKSRRNMELILSQQQIACLLANAFFCTFPRQSSKSADNGKSTDSRVPEINFSTLYSESNSSRKIEKLKCIVNYFKRVTQNMPTGTVTYTRQFMPVDRDHWFKVDKKLTKLHVSITGTIEDDGGGMLQTDFANKFVGGGVLGNGLVQEEIRFVLCPEMILSKLFTEMLTDNEVLIMTGCERFSNYTGYSDSFRFSGDHEDKTQRDRFGRRYTQVVAMDALVFRYDHFLQFEQNKFFRELNKAYCAFMSRETDNLPAVCTGNWGCGAFGGDKELKALIQMVAASAAGRDVCYLTFGDQELCQQFYSVHQALKERNASIRDIVDIVKEYSRITENVSLFTFILRKLSPKRGGFEGDQEWRNRNMLNDNTSFPPLGTK